MEDENYDSERFKINSQNTFCCYEQCGASLLKGWPVIYDPETLTYCNIRCYNAEMKRRRERYANDEFHPERY